MAGWVAFILSLVLSFVFYSVHPSQVDVSTVREKLKVHICGYKLYLFGCWTQGQFSFECFQFYNRYVYVDLSSLIQETEDELDSEVDDDWNDSGALMVRKYSNIPTSLITSHTCGFLLSSLDML